MKRKYVHFAAAAFVGEESLGYKSSLKSISLTCEASIDLRFVLLTKVSSPNVKEFQFVFLNAEKNHNFGKKTLLQPHIGL